MHSYRGRRRLTLLMGMAGAWMIVLSPALGQRFGRSPTPQGPWMDRSLSPDRRADLVIAQMTLDEKISLVHGGGGFGFGPPPGGSGLGPGAGPPPGSGLNGAPGGGPAPAGPGGPFSGPGGGAA